MADLEPIRAYFLEKIGGDRALLPADDASLVEEGVLDSFGLAELVSAIERLYGVRVEPRDAKVSNFESIAKIGRFVDANRC
ncbi:MAG TPA: acyl carrier protein [Planctomycetota bacterium]|nr:acyl carrier protein [Planctomycetota bacterium]